MVTGWLFDLYPSHKGITLWLIDEEGNKHCCWDEFHPPFFLSLNSSDMRRAEALAQRCPVPLTTQHTQRMELYSGDTLTVLQVNVRNTTQWRDAVWYFEKFFPHFVFFNSDIPVAQLYLYHTQLFPLAFGEYRITAEGKLADRMLHDSIEALEYTIPPLTIMGIRNACDFVPPKYQGILQLELTYDGTTYALEQENPVDLLEALNWHLDRCDPDIIMTEYGDATLLPQLHTLSQRYHIPLLLNRDKSVGYFTSRESSFFQYGKIIHKDGAFELAGRWHVDVENSFTVVESDLDGLFEIARLTQVPPQHQSRATIGTGLSSRQLAWAYRNNVLIPAKKREPEEFKTAATLILADRGGLIFLPPMGYHEDVAELDFVSMYPTIMVEHNVSPETINCRCCSPDAVPHVPELGYTICTKREGIVPAILRAVVAKRAYYKKKKKQLKEQGNPNWIHYDRRQNALKWMLVTCFGYLGYKNARFGKIEAHESVNAFSRDAILQAKEIAEARGFHLLHAIIDCMWMKPARPTGPLASLPLRRSGSRSDDPQSGGKTGATERDYELLCHEIAEGVGIDISLEGIYNWIVFPASKMDPVIPTANRYAGWYRHGELKIRGIEARRHDTPKFIKSLQAAMLKQMSAAQNIRELEAMVPTLLDTVSEYLTTLRMGNVNPMELVIRRNLSKEADEYTNNSISAVVSRLIEEAGIHLSAGESVEFIIIDHTGKKKPEKAKPLALYALEDGYDIEQYTELLLKAAETLLLPFGYDVKTLKTLFALPTMRRKKNYQRDTTFSSAISDTAPKKIPTISLSETTGIPVRGEE